MNEYISKTTAIEELEEEIGTIDKPDARDALINMGLKIALRDIKRLPAADVQPVKHGYWKKGKGYLVCSNCGMTFDTIGYTYEEQDEAFRYCSCCGFKMDGEKNE